jgi:hypothetical protein
LKQLEKEGLLRLEYSGVTIIDLDRLRSYGDWPTTLKIGLYPPEFPWSLR